MKNLFLVLSLVFTFSSYAKRFSVMTYNVENLFDTKHDEGKEDYTYLPKALKDTSRTVKEYCKSLTKEYYRKTCFGLDWNQSVLKAKLENLGQVISSYDNGNGPDIISLQEVENLRALKMLLGPKGPVSHLGYKYFSFVEGPDKRGIDVAVASRFKITKTKYHEISLLPQSSKLTRGVLETRVKIGTRLITLLSNHWPSQGNRDITRVKAAKVTLKAAKAAFKTTGDIVITLGDFNTAEDDEINALKTIINKDFVDVSVRGMKTTKEKTAPGTYSYRGKWGSLDKIFVFKGRSSGRSFTTHYSTYINFFENFMLWKSRDSDIRDRDWKHYRPMRFGSRSMTGFSDHLPVAIKFSI